jgi:hypothetical protein
VAKSKFDEKLLLVTVAHARDDTRAPPWRLSEAPRPGPRNLRRCTSAIDYGAPSQFLWSRPPFALKTLANFDLPESRARRCGNIGHIGPSSMRGGWEAVAVLGWSARSSRVVATMAAEQELRHGSHNSVTDTQARAPRRMVRLTCGTALLAQGSNGQSSCKTQASGSRMPGIVGARARE